jgi:hypothetical protein
MMKSDGKVSGRLLPCVGKYTNFWDYNEVIE